MSSMKRKFIMSNLKMENVIRQGFVRAHLAIKPARDIDIYPTKGILVFKRSDQHNVEPIEIWNGEISSKDGWVTVPVGNLSKISDLKIVRIKFDTYHDDTDEDAEYD